ncbi:AraC family transcriptional regulator [Asaia sp. VD9]|uniref:AraC family transcriptional regulator n=1 Tax=Asaia sp. VD9 TaxID=3081235 RepID=UPI003018538D
MSFLNGIPTAHTPSGQNGRGAQNPAILELIPEQKTGSFRWHQHDYPAAIACWNYHPEYELHLITQGAGRAMIGDHIGPFAVGQLVLIGPDLPHAWFSPLSEGEVLRGRDVVLQFSQGWIEGLIALCPELSGLTRMLAESVHGLEFTGGQALAHAEALVALGAQSPGQKLASCVSLLSALSQSPWRRLSTGRDRSLPGGAGVSGAARINRLVRQLLTTDPATIRHETIASSIGMTPSGFSRQFRAVTGETFMSFVQKLRIGHACHLLATTPMAVTDICREAGFSNLSNFNRVFLSLRGCTPRQFRQQSHQITAPHFMVRPRTLGASERRLQEA